MARAQVFGGVTLAAAAALAGLYACSGTEPEVEEPAPAPAPVAPPAAPKPPPGPLPALIFVQAQFVSGPDGKPKPGPAKMTLLRTDGKTWYPQVIEDPDSNVFHKGMPWRDGILTIGAEKAMIKHWKPSGDTWTATTLWEREWGGRFDRMRDIEAADVDGDGQEELVVVTHDAGVVAVGDEGADGKWTFQEFDQKPDTFVHEVEVGDVDGDKKVEFYVTPSARNKASGASQPGGVARYDFKDGKYVRTQVASWEESHAKEILVTDLDGDGVDELYVAREGHVEKAEGAGKPVLKDPAKVIRMVPGKGGKWTEQVVATLVDEKQCRFLVPGDVNGDGKKDIVAAGMDTGLWMLDRAADGTFTNVLIEGNSGGFEHATDVADLDGDGKLEIYAASEKKGARFIKKYWWDGTTWKSEKVVDIPEQHITWNVMDGRL
jgi:hypothetical protein